MATEQPNPKPRIGHKPGFFALVFNHLYAIDSFNLLLKRAIEYSFTDAKAMAYNIDPLWLDVWNNLKFWNIPTGLIEFPFAFVYCLVDWLTQLGTNGKAFTYARRAGRLAALIIPFILHKTVSYATSFVREMIEPLTPLREEHPFAFYFSVTLFTLTFMALATAILFSNTTGFAPGVSHAIFAFRAILTHFLHSSTWASAVTIGVSGATGFVMGLLSLNWVTRTREFNDEVKDNTLTTATPRKQFSEDAERLLRDHPECSGPRMITFEGYPERASNAGETPFSR